MERSLSARSCHVAVAAGLLALAVPAVRADPLPAYTATDLGAGPTSFGSDSTGSRIVVAADGRSAYAFPNNGVPVAYPTGFTLPPVPNPAPVWSPMTYGNPKNAFSTWEHTLLTTHGVFIGTDVVGVSGHSASAGTGVYAGTLQPGGTVGPLHLLWSSPNNHELYHAPTAWAIAVNPGETVLGAGTDDRGMSQTYLVYDLKSGVKTDLSQVVPGWHVDQALALDDRGRILVTAESSATGWQQHSYLLSPAGVPADPVPVPEPSTLAVIGLGLVAVALRGRKSGGDRRRVIC